MSNFKKTLESTNDLVNNKFPGASRVDKLLKKFQEDFGKVNSAKQWESRCLEMSKKLDMDVDLIEDIYGMPAIVLVTDRDSNKSEAVKKLNKAYGKLIDKEGE